MIVDVNDDKQWKRRELMRIPVQAKGCRVIPPSLYGLVWPSEKALSFTSCWGGWVQAGWSFCPRCWGVWTVQRRMEKQEAWMDLDGSRGYSSVQFSRVWLSVTPWTVARQASLSITNSQSWLKLTFSVMPSNHLILCHPLLLLPSIFPSIRGFSNVSSSHQVAKVLEFQLWHQSFQWAFV